MSSLIAQPRPADACAGWNGEMAQRIAAFDWSGTALGPRAMWSKSLVSAVQLLLASPVPLVMLWGKPGTMIYNDAYSIFAGGRHPFLLGKPVEEGWPEIASFNRHVVDTCLAGGTLSYSDKELTLHRSGRPESVWMDLHYSPVIDDSGEPAGVIAVVFETTGRVLAERKREEAEAALLGLTHNLEARVAQEVLARAAAEDRLRQAQKLEAVGSLTGGVAHDFNNVLQVISANLQLLAIATRENPSLKGRIDASNAAVARGAKLAQQLLAFARRQPLNPSVTNPTAMLQDMSELLRRAITERIRLEFALAHATSNVFVDRNQLENAILNLVINSRDAISGQGVIRIHVADANPATDARMAELGLPPGDYVKLSVVDNGAGMSEQVKSRIFEPFYSTKPEGHGTGLGLSMVFGFVKQSAGHIDVQSVVGEGTTFSMYFPKTDKLEEQDRPKSGTGSHVGGETVLVVEDNPDVRLAAIDMFAQLGYRVLSAQDGDSALAVLQRSKHIDLLFTDVVMPGTVRSSELARIAAAEPHHAKVIFASGYTRDIIFHEGRLDEGVVLLSKPYSIEDLARTVREVLDR
jgi:signal transduction histidine kinase